VTAKWLEAMEMHQIAMTLQAFADVKKTWKGNNVADANPDFLTWIGKMTLDVHLVFVSVMLLFVDQLLDMDKVIIIRQIKK